MKTIINVKWGIPAEQPTLEQLPTTFSEAQTLWSQDNKGNFEKIVSLIEPYLSANFILSEIPSFILPVPNTMPIEVFISFIF
mgnify:CR=1 FL=1